MDKMWQRILEVLKLPPKRSFVLWASSSFILFAPEDWIKLLSLDLIRQSSGWRTILGLVAVYSFIAWITDISLLVNSRYLAPRKNKKQSETQQKKQQDNLLNRIKTISQEEKWILEQAVSKQEQTVYSDNAANYLGGNLAYAALTSLLTLGIFRPTRQGTVYHIEDHVWTYIQNNKHILKNRFKPDSPPNPDFIPWV